ncbi:MAG: hypothetical protein KA313_01215 [Pseudarcicella sp.]|nr:hypothetical protein [Pseudarcicella sp.]MBP6409698.1 hypothetical protein [Pseudarcicella sp.]
METLTIITYAIYALFVALLTVFVAKLLFKNSQTFMIRIFDNKEDLALATNKLFEVGFFLFGFGIGLWYLAVDDTIASTKILFEVLSVKIGGFTIFMGVMLFGNLFMFFRGLKARKRADETKLATALNN